MWQFSSPEIVFGDEALSRLADLQARRVAIITDRTLVEAGLVDLLLEHLTPAEVESELFCDVESEPSIQTMERARQIIGRVQPDYVIALGGGSVLDVAKVAWFMNEHPQVPLEEISIFDTYQRPRTGLIAIPTTSGSGADVTVGAVLTDLADKRKVVAYARELQPTLVLVDPLLTREMPRRLTADTGMDAISHGIEAFTGAWHNDFADGLSLQALRLALKYLPRAWSDGSDEEARERMHNAATIAGLAITNASIALGHALAHPLGAVFSLPHGRAIGVMLPYSMVYTANGGGTRYGELARSLGLPAESEAMGLQSLLAMLRDLVTTLSMPTTVRDLGPSVEEFEAELPNLVAGAAMDHQMLTTIRVPDEADIERLYRCAYAGDHVDF
ncbi:MAG: iron-containing alcohol dehydrogenase [Chloroflexota bacterium]|nr:MAG: iron-containing alcohol dehydrogenase [Chloroflexota bacterium]